MKIEPKKVILKRVTRRDHQNLTTSFVNLTFNHLYGKIYSNRDIETLKKENIIYKNKQQ